MVVAATAVQELLAPLSLACGKRKQKRVIISGVVTDGNQRCVSLSIIGAVCSLQVQQQRQERSVISKGVNHLDTPSSAANKRSVSACRDPRQIFARHLEVALAVVDPS